MEKERKNEEQKAQADRTTAADSRRKLLLLDADVSGRKLKVVFTEASGRAGERVLLDRGLAVIYERQGKARIIRENDNNVKKKEEQQ